MTIHKPKGTFSFECDVCHDALNTDETQFRPAVERLAENKWAARKVADYWRHYCPNCRPKDTAPQRRIPYVD